MLNLNVNCLPFRNVNEIKGVGEFLKEVKHNNRILVCTLDLSNYVVMQNYDKNREHYFKLLGLGSTLSYGVPKYFFELDGKLCDFSKKLSFSHYHLYLNYLENIHSNFVFTKNPPKNQFNNFTLLKGYNLLGKNLNAQYISNNLYFYSNFYKPQFYDLKNCITNHSNFDQFDLKNAENIKNFLFNNKKVFKEHLINSYDLLNKK